MFEGLIKHPHGCDVFVTSLLEVCATFTQISNSNQFIMRIQLHLVTAVHFFCHHFGINFTIVHTQALLKRIADRTRYILFLFSIILVNFYLLLQQLDLDYLSKYCQYVIYLITIVCYQPFLAPPVATQSPSVVVQQLPQVENPARRSRVNSGSSSESPWGVPLPRWVTGELPAPDLYLQVLQAVTRYLANSVFCNSCDLGFCFIRKDSTKVFVMYFDALFIIYF